MSDGGEDRFDTVAITWSQPEAAVMLAMFAFYGIPAFAVGYRHASASPIHMVALQGIAIRVACPARDEALGLLAEVADRPAAIRPYPIGSAFLYRGLIGFALFLLVLGVTAGSAFLALVGGTPLALLMAAPPPTRTPSTFQLPRRGGPSRPAASSSDDGDGDDDGDGAAGVS